MQLVKTSFHSSSSSELFCSAYLFSQNITCYIPQLKVDFQNKRCFLSPLYQGSCLQAVRFFKNGLDTKATRSVLFWYIVDFLRNKIFIVPDPGFQAHEKQCGLNMTTTLFMLLIYNKSLKYYLKESLSPPHLPILWAGQGGCWWQSFTPNSIIIIIQATHSFLSSDIHQVHSRHGSNETHRW